MNIQIWGRYHCYGMFLMCIVFLISGSILPFIMFSTLSFGILWVRGWNTIRFLHPRGGLANLITLARFAGLVSIVLLREELSPAGISILLAALIVLDGFDGFAARIRKEQTVFGASFDMENDALFVCVTSCMLYGDGMMNWIILIPAFLRYVYAVLIRLLNMQDIPEKRTRIGPVGAVILFIVLAADFILPLFPRYVLSVAASLLILFSFTWSFILLRKTGGTVLIISPHAAGQES